jgi:hypothetical protein
MLTVYSGVFHGEVGVSAQRRTARAQAREAEEQAARDKAAQSLAPTNVRPLSREGVAAA